MAVCLTPGEAVPPPLLRNIYPIRHRRHARLLRNRLFVFSQYEVSIAASLCKVGKRMHALRSLGKL